MQLTNNKTGAVAQSLKIQDNVRGPLVLILAAMCIGLAPIGLRFSQMEPSVTGMWRFTFALPILFAFGIIFKQTIGRPSPAIIASGAFFGLDICLWHTALTHTSVANATFFVNLGSVGVGLLAWVFLQQKPSKIWPIAAILALSGAAAMAIGAPTDQQSGLLGDGLALLASFCVAGYLLCATIARNKASGFQAAFWLTASAIPVTFIFALFTGEQLIPSDISYFGAPLFLAVMAQCIGQGLLIYGVGLTKPAISGVILLIQPVVAGVLAWPLFDEALAPIQIAGAGIILCGVWLAGRSR
ncbi:DMT family transporter [Hirschia baltica]|uniref:EamA domain-containing protein n=1 Tax=Hirschia baltica (strain ATCC 49814 / DSM 5838 / IFAM 1418) TaxID=582402 RepID=C6XLT8_HIRBI|nr:DMT family transporter [Hirschia baltica]ACT57994.1 protein of unknown function DUF6 transmembrane [Hirschia baltica ATCC 49814]